MSNVVWKIGDVTITRVVEAESPLPLVSLLPDAQPSALSRHESWLKPYFLDDEGQCLLSVPAFIVESSGKRIIVDTCFGEHVNPYGQLEPISGDFLSSLSEAGFSKESIDVVLCTHLHFDHVGWNTMKSGNKWVPTFPNARYLFSIKEYEHWKAEPANDIVSNFDNAVKPVIEAGLADLVEMNHQITDEVWLEPTRGHSPGHMSVRIESKGKQAMIAGDIAHHPVQWAEPDWSLPLDYDTKQAAATRRRIVTEHADSSLLVIGTHYAAPSAGRLISVDGGIQFRTDV